MREYLTSVDCVEKEVNRLSRIENLVVPSEHDGLGLAVLTVLPDGEPRALIQFSHGMAEHKERYQPVMEFLAAHGYACVINDHRGHGASVKSPDDLYGSGRNIRAGRCS